MNGNFFLPTYGTVLAAVSFDQTGTTRIGRYVLNHSFMRPGLVTTAVATAAPPASPGGCSRTDAVKKPRLRW